MGFNVWVTLEFKVQKKFLCHESKLTSYSSILSLNVKDKKQFRQGEVNFLLQMTMCFVFNGYKFIFMTDCAMRKNGASAFNAP